MWFTLSEFHLAAMMQTAHCEALQNWGRNCGWDSVERDSLRRDSLKRDAIARLSEETQWRDSMKRLSEDETLRLVNRTHSGFVSSEFEMQICSSLDSPNGTPRVRRFKPNIWFRTKNNLNRIARHQAQQTNSIKSLSLFLSETVLHRSWRHSGDLNSSFCLKHLIWKSNSPSDDHLALLTKFCQCDQEGQVQEYSIVFLTTSTLTAIAFNLSLLNLKFNLSDDGYSFWLLSSIELFFTTWSRHVQPRRSSMRLKQRFYTELW